MGAGWQAEIRENNTEKTKHLVFPEAFMGSCAGECSRKILDKVHFHESGGLVTDVHGRDAEPVANSEEQEAKEHDLYGPRTSLQGFMVRQVGGEQYHGCQNWTEEELTHAFCSNRPAISG